MKLPSFATVIIVCLLTSLAWANLAAATSIGIVNVEQVEATSKVVARLKQQAALAQQKKTGKATPLTAEYAEALEASLSEFRSTLPSAVAELARKNKLDVVIEQKVAKEKKLTGMDLTAQAQQLLDQKTANSKWIGP